VGDNLHGIHARVVLFRDAVEHAERAPDKQQIGGNGADALPDLRSDETLALSSLVDYTNANLSSCWVS
jgi:hypothetical protein